MRKLVIILLLMATICCCTEKAEKQAGGLSVALPFEKFPRKYTCDGDNISPPVEIDGVSKKARTMAIIMDDPDAHYFTHWIVWNIPANVSLIPENIPAEPVVSEPINAVQGVNDFKSIGYGGPCPPFGIHKYRIQVYVLDTYLSLKPGSTKKELENAMKGHILQHAVVMAEYSR